MGVKEVTLELPAGLIDPGDKSPLEAAKCELREETGYAGGKWISLEALNVSSAKATTRAMVFLARDVALTSAQNLDRNERIECVQVSLEEFMKLISNGAIHDTSSIAARLFKTPRDMGFTLS
jgi:8-oxo-dGTP pyrophosphatase MutT (NUDIX family)